MGKQQISIFQQKRQIAEIIDRSGGNRISGMAGIVQGYDVIVIALDRHDFVVQHKRYAGIRRLRRGGIANIAEMINGKAVLLFQKSNGI